MYLFKIDFNIILPSSPRTFKWFISFTFSIHNPACISLLFHVCCMLYPSKLVSLEGHNVLNSINESRVSGNCSQRSELSNFPIIISKDAIPTLCRVEEYIPKLLIEEWKRKMPHIHSFNFASSLCTVHVTLSRKAQSSG